MKHVFLTIILSISFFAYGHVPTEYKPILEDGKEWILYNAMSPASSKSSYRTRVWIEGDSIINDKKATRLLMENIDQN